MEVSESARVSREPVDGHEMKLWDFTNDFIVSWYGAGWLASRLQQTVAYR